MLDDQSPSSNESEGVSEGVDEQFLRIAKPADRVGGSIVDSLIKFVVLWLPIVGLSRSGWALNFWLSVSLPVLFTFLYDWLWVSFKGATPGKLVVGTRVVRESDSSRPSFKDAALRSSIYLVALVPLVGQIASPLLFVVCFALLFVDRKCRTLMDRLAGTVVIDKFEMEIDAEAEALKPTSPS